MDLTRDPAVATKGRSSLYICVHYNRDYHRMCGPTPLGWAGGRCRMRLNGRRLYIYMWSDGEGEESKHGYSIGVIRVVNAFRFNILVMRNIKILCWSIYRFSRSRRLQQKQKTYVII